MPTSWPDLNASDPYGSLGSASATSRQSPSRPRNNTSPNVSRRPRRVYVQDQHATSVVKRIRKRHTGSERVRKLDIHHSPKLVRRRGRRTSMAVRRLPTKFIELGRRRGRTSDGSFRRSYRQRQHLNLPYWAF